MQSLLWIVVAFVAGSLPFSIWVGYLLLRTDIRAIGDGNPGATNVWRAGGVAPGFLALLLDFAKGTLPVALALHFAQLSSWTLILVATAPVAGHAFSPFLLGRGGKAVAVTGGVWAGLTAWEGPTIAGLMLFLGTKILGPNGWAVLLALMAMLAYLLLTPPEWNNLVPRPAPITILLIGSIHLAILINKHRHDLARFPKIELPLWTGPRS